MSEILKGSTDVTRYVHLQDATTGASKTGLTVTDLDLQYVRNRTAPVAKVDVTALAATDTAHTDNRMIEVDATDQPGLYRVDWPDAAFATGVDKVILTVKGTAIQACHDAIDLIDVNKQDGVRMGLTALPNAAADAAGGLVISDAGGLDADAQRSDVAAILVDTGTTLDDFLDTEIGTIATAVAAIQAKTDNLPTDPADQSLIMAAIDAVDNFVDTEVAAITTAVVGDVDGHTLKEHAAIQTAALAGKCSGLETTTATFRDATDAANRIVATVDADGNRTAVTLTDP